MDHHTLSHELRIPLTGILGMAELLNNQNLSPTQKEQVEIIREAGYRLLAFANKMLKNAKEI